MSTHILAIDTYGSQRVTHPDTRTQSVPRTK